MRKLIGFGAIVTAVILSWSSFRASAFPAPPERYAKWEYGELSSRSIAKGKGKFFGPNDELPVQPRPKGKGGFGGEPAAAQQEQPVPKSTATIRWVTVEDEVTGDGWVDLAEKLKAPPIRNNTPAAQRLRVFNKLGSEGWELIDAQTPITTGTGSWTFKRRMP